MNRQLIPGLPDNVSLLGFTLKGDGEPTVESLTAELATANETIASTNEKLTALEKGAGDWKASIDPDHANNPNLQKFDTPKDLLNSYIELQSKMGADKVVIPKDANDTAAWDALATAIGVPKVAADYQVTDIKRPDGMPSDEKQLEAFKEKAHELKLSPHQVDGLHKFVVENNIQTYNSLTAEAEETAKKVETELSNEYGAAWAEKKELAQKVIDAHAPENHELSAKILSDPAAVRMLIKVGERMSEDGSIEGDGGSGRLSPTEARAKINEIMADDKHPYNNNDAPGHKEAVEYMTSLYSMEDAGKK